MLIYTLIIQTKEKIRVLLLLTAHKVYPAKWTTHKQICFYWDIAEQKIYKPLKQKKRMKTNFELNGRTFEVTTRTDKNATSNYDTNLYVSENKNVVSGCTVKKSTPKSEIVELAKKCAMMYLTTNYFNN